MEAEALATVRQISTAKQQAIWEEVAAGISAATAPVPSRRHLKTRVVIGAGTAAAAIVAVAITMSPSAAAWSAVPTQLTGSSLFQAENACRIQVNKLPYLEGRPPSDPLLSVLGEKRGTTTSVFLTDGHTIALCLGTKDSRYVGIETLPAPPGQNDAIHIDDANGGDLTPGTGTRFAYGRVSEGITEVIVKTTGGDSVTATCDGRFFMAWWPSGANVADVIGLDSSGRVVAQTRPAAAPAGAQSPTHRPA
ncbi:hypothetical protein [Catenulispora pinisilvae]|uniref:hypothetical protein n=1 Tax=Catenulispora pinisilvae TaxID=2705253 RepID=UPI001891AB95|nr:hypothetical protein [Catenulispora pinisilvae]